MSVFGGEVEVGFADRVDAVFFLASGHGDVQAGPIDGSVDDGVGGIHGGALGAVDGGRVAQVHVGAGVVGGDEHVLAGVDVAYGECAVVGEVGDGEELAVDDPPEVFAVCGVELRVLAGDDGVSDADGV